MTEFFDILYKSIYPKAEVDVFNFREDFLKSSYFDSRPITNSSYCFKNVQERV